MERLTEYISSAYKRWIDTNNASDLFDLAEISAVEGQLFELKMLAGWACEQMPDSRELSEIADKIDREYESLVPFLEAPYMDRQRDFCDLAAKQSREEAQHG